MLSRLRGGLPPTGQVLDGLAVHYPRYFYVPKLTKKLAGRLYARGLLPWVRDRYRNAPPDLLDGHFAWPDGVGVGGIGRALGMPYVVTLRGRLWVDFRNESIKRQCVEALQNAAAVISLSESMVKAYCDEGVPREKFTVIHNGVDRSLFRPGDMSEARRLLGFPTEARLVLCVAYYQRRKGIMELVRALARLPKDVSLVLVGSEVPAEGTFYRDVLEEIEGLGLSGRVIRVGQQPHERIPAYMRAANATVLASYWEGCPNVVVESLGCGRPVVATPVGSVPEIIVPDENGYVVPVGEVGALAEGIASALGREWDPEVLSGSVKSWDEVAAEVHGVFTKVLGPRAG
jgi:glycosyltransferase involved in cell wall biosynthesis